MRLPLSKALVLLPILSSAALISPAQDVIDRGAPGVIACFYDVGEDMRALPELVPGQQPNVARIIHIIDLDAGDFPIDDHFITDVTGFINVTQSGQHTFRLVSDDGAQLWIDNQLVVDHDGLHGPDPKDGQIELAMWGQHVLRLRHFDSTGGERLALMWKSPGATDFAVVPASALTHSKHATLETAPGNKRIIPPLRRGRPGDGSPLMQAHPSLPGFPPQLHEEEPGLRRRFFLGRLRVMRDPMMPFREPVVAWLPPGTDRQHIYGRIRSLAAPPYDNHLVVWQHERGEALRVFQDDEVRPTQGCSFRFGVLASLELEAGKRLEFEKSVPVPFETLAVRAMSNGFEIQFTKPLDPRVGWDPESYYVEQWPFDAENGISPARDGVRYPVKSASVFDDRRRVFLEIDNLKPSHVVYIRLLPPCVSEDGELPWSTEAWYTLNVIPKDRVGKILTPPPPEPQNFPTDEEAAAGWKLLFDGKTTNGWRGYKKDRFPDGWIVKDGCLVRVAPAGDVITEDEFENFELKLEWRICAAGNSGIFYRVDESVGWPWETGPEMQVLDNAEHADGRNPKTSAGSSYALYAPIRDVTEPVGLFNRARILVDGNHVEHWLNGVKIVEYELGSEDWQTRVADSKFKQWPQYGRINRGHIVLQDHGDQVWYRNIKIRELPSE